MKKWQKETDQYNVVYHSMGKSDRSAMPLGNGQTGVSVWVQEDGDLQFYIGHTDAQSEVDRNLKLGKVILRLDPNPFTSDAEFTQELVLREGCVKIEARKGQDTLRADVFVAAHSQEIYVTIDSTFPVTAQAELFCWRTAPRLHNLIPNRENDLSPFINESADHVYQLADGVVFYHKNETTCVKSTAIIEALSDHLDKIIDTLENRTFGGYMTLSDGISTGQKYISGRTPATRHTLKISTFCEQQEDTSGLIDRVINKHKNMPAASGASAAAADTAQFWNDYFGKSYIFVRGDEVSEAVIPEDIARVSLEPQETNRVPSNVTQGYLLSKYMFACTAKGSVPIYFNGMIFNLMPGLNKHLEFADFCRTFAAQPESEPTLEINPDEKGWEFCINLWQNVRLPYAAMLERGEFDAVRVLFNYYRNFRSINRARAERYYHAEGQFNSEMTHTFGLQPLSAYGADRSGLPDGYATNRWGGAIDISPGLELCSMMLDYYDYTRDEKFLTDEVLVYAQDLLHFIETRFTERVDGKIHMTKLQCVETYFDTTNPITVVAGMQAVTERILALPEKIVANRAFIETFKETIPDISTEKDDLENIVLAPAQFYENKRMNVESPVLYPVYPFRMFTHYQGDLKQIRDTYEHNKAISNCQRPHLHEYSPGTPSYGGWQYLSMTAALLGMTEEAGDMLLHNCSFKNPGCRFPAMWGPVHDAVPDGDHAANITNTLQLMAMQTEGDKIYILPAWPKDWDISFKLYAGNNTVVECDYLNGKLTSIVVEPGERMKDVIFCMEERK